MFMPLKQMPHEIVSDGVSLSYKGKVWKNISGNTWMCQCKLNKNHLKGLASKIITVFNPEREYPQKGARDSEPIRPDSQVFEQV